MQRHFNTGELSSFARKSGTLSALLKALDEAASTDQVDDQVSDQVNALLKCLAKGPLTALACMKKLGLSHRPTFRKNYLQPAMEGRLIERTQPDKPSSSLQKYRRTAGDSR